jgi:hypothetical protein
MTRRVAILLLLLPAHAARAECRSDAAYERAVASRYIVWDFDRLSSRWTADVAHAGALEKGPEQELGMTGYWYHRRVAGQPDCDAIERVPGTLDTQPFGREITPLEVDQDVMALSADGFEFPHGIEARVFLIGARDSLAWDNRPNSGPERNRTFPSRKVVMEGVAVRSPWVDVVYGAIGKGGRSFVRVGVPAIGVDADLLTAGKKPPYLRLQTTEYSFGGGWGGSVHAERRPEEKLTFVEPAAHWSRWNDEYNFRYGLHGSVAAAVEPVGFHAASFGGDLWTTSIDPRNYGHLDLFADLTAFHDRAVYQDPLIGTAIGARASIGSRRGSFGIEGEAGVNRPDTLRDIPQARNHSDTSVTLYVRISR